MYAGKFAFWFSRSGKVLEIFKKLPDDANVTDLFFGPYFKELTLKHPFTHLLIHSSVDIY